MAREVYLVLILFLLVWLARAGPKDGVSGPLVDYMYREDPNYDVSVIDIIDRTGYTTYILNMTSQQWYDENLSNRPIWWHYLTVHVPDRAEYPDAAYLYIGGRSNTNNPPSITDRIIAKAGEMTEKWEVTSAVLELIPNQPITFLEESGPLNNSIERTEDGIIAWTWVTFLDLESEGIHEPEVLLRMPMCKATVLAMDTITDLVEGLTDDHIDKFEVAGESKRGWTAWLVGAIDDRVKTLVPVVLSCLNMHPSFHHYYQSFGGWPYYMWDYWSQGIMGRIDDPEMAVMEAIIDPYSYIEFLDMPILQVQASSDEFFLPDDTWYYWDELPSNNKYFWMLEGGSHWMSRNEQYDQYWDMMGLFLVSVIREEEFPSFSWSRGMNETGGWIDLVIDEQNPPETITVFSSPSAVPQRREWRLKMLGLGEIDTNITWTESDPTDMGEGRYQIYFENPDEGYLGFFVNLVYEMRLGPDLEEFIASTEIQIIPDGFPFEDCEGQDCRGILK